MQDCDHCEQGEPNHTGNLSHKKNCQRTHKLPYLRSEGETSLSIYSLSYQLKLCPSKVYNGTRSLVPSHLHCTYSWLELHCALSSYTCHTDDWRLQTRCLVILWNDSALANKIFCHY